jgi:hypothetical protein
LVTTQTPQQVLLEGGLGCKLLKQTSGAEKQAVVRVSQLCILWVLGQVQGQNMTGDSWTLEQLIKARVGTYTIRKTGDPIRT